MLYHHSRSLDSVVFGEIKANPDYFDDLAPAYFWLKKKFGFLPVFLAVGETEEDIRMTGYQCQWRQLLIDSPRGNTYRKKGEYPNYVLFSFEEVEGKFLDYMYWLFIMNSTTSNRKVDSLDEKYTLKRSWTKSKWLKKAKKDPHSVQMVTSSLYLPDAKGVYVRNKQTKKTLEEMGFENVEVRRILLESPD
jgi:hypothetical protein